MESSSARFDLHGMRVVVTGSSSGIGASIALRLAELGAKVGIHYHRHGSEAEAIIEEIRSNGGTAEGFQSDLTNFVVREELIPAMIDKLGGLDALVNNAGAPQGESPFPGIKKTDWDRTLALNAEAPFFLAQQAFSYMQAHGGGRIINISSIGVKYGGSARTLHYAMAKSAMETLTLGLAKLGAPHGILVNTVRAGVIDTPFWKDKTREEIDARVRLIPMGRIGKPPEVAEIVCFLLSSSASYISGQTIAVSGGE